MKTYKSILVQIVFLLLLSHLSFSQEVEVNLGGNSTSDAFVVRDSSGNVLLKMDGDKNFGINTEQPDGILIKGRNTLEDIDAGDPITIVGGSTPVTGGGSITVFGGGSVDYAAGGSINIASGYGLYDGGDVNITSGGGAFDIGDINISTSSNGNSDGGSITIATGYANSGFILLLYLSSEACVQVPVYVPEPIISTKRPLGLRIIPPISKPPFNSMPYSFILM